MKRVFIALGSNLGDRAGNIDAAVCKLEGCGLVSVRRSSLYETAPQDVVDQPWFLNAVLSAETKLFPMQLLDRLQAIERELGRNRTRTVRRGPRTVDLDVLLFGRAVIERPRLTVPHPRMTARRFVLEPLVEIAPDLRHPLTGRLFREYLKLVLDQPVRVFR